MIHFLLIYFLTFLSAARAEEPPAGGGKEITIEEFLQSLSSVEGVVVRRDPFQESPPPFEPPPVVATPSTTQGQQEFDDVSEDTPLLERFPITDYEVVAVLIGDQYPRALVRLPREGSGQQKVVIVKEKDKLGNRKGVVTRIVQQGVIVQQALKSKLGFVDKTEVLLKVGGTASGQRESLKTVSQDSKGMKERSSKKASN